MEGQIGERERIRELELEIAALPAGYISKKNIRGKIQHYYQWTEDGKKKSKYVDDVAAAKLTAAIENRRELQKELQSLKRTLPPLQKKKSLSTLFDRFKTSVITGDALKKFIEPVKLFKHRDCFTVLENFLSQGEGSNNSSGKVLILYGLRRTGKTTLIRQAIASIAAHSAASSSASSSATLSDYDFKKTIFIQVRPGMSLADINADLKLCSEHGYRNIFIDEVTLADDFIEGAALFSDIYAASGMKIVLSGTDSLGFLFSKNEELYDRCIMLHTTWIPYVEFERVLGIKGIDEYIRFGGTMSLGGTHYNNGNNDGSIISTVNNTVSILSTFNSKESTDEYIDSAIAKNIQHSLKFYQDGGHFRHLADLFEKNELTSAINRVVEDINHRFTIDVLTRDFLSHDLGISKRNLRKDRGRPTDILDRIDQEAFTDGLRRTLEILNKNEQTVEITDAHRVEIKEYLDLLDLTIDIPTEFIPVKSEKNFRTAISQPGMRYSQAEALVRQLLLDEEFQNISAVDRAWILERILNEIRGRMMEDIVLLETKMANPTKNVFRLQFAVGEFDMVIADPNEITAEIYEIKHSEERVPEQYKNLIDQEKCSATAFRYGTITRKAVIYRGKTTSTAEGIDYINVEDYLKQLW